MIPRPHVPDADGRPLDRAGFVKGYFKPAGRAVNEAIAKLPKDRRQAAMPKGLRSTTSGIPAPRCSSPKARA
jgi:hypothetical protein